MHEGPSSLPCSVKGTHTITITLKPEDVASAEVVGMRHEVWTGFYDAHCDFCGKDMTGSRLKANAP
jgi:hypothetical protein